ncbi:hypothetical protein ACSBR2_030927 [Camellia fascicularis]
MEREKRIAAKTAQLASSQKTRKQLPTKLALSSVKGTKFGDSEPGSSSPPQRSKIRTASTGSSESHKASKSNKSSNGSHLPGNRLTRPVSSLPEPRKENSDVTPDPKVPMARIQRLSEPKTVSSPYVAPVKSRRAELASKPKLSNEPERKDRSAIINLDKSKAATLPELKIRTSKVPLDVGRNTSAPKEMTQKVNVKKSSLTPGSAELNRNDDQHTHQSDVDDKPVMDKTVVMLECEKPSFPIVHPSQENMGVQKERYDNHDNLEKTDVISEYAAIRAPASPMEGVDIEPIQSQLQEQPRVYEVTASYAEKEPPNSSSMYSAEKPYLAPLARLSSLEDPCTDNSEYGKAPSTNLETAAMGLETAKAQVSGFENLKLEKIPEVLEKPQAKTNASSGMDVAELSKSTYMELQWKKVHRYVIFMIDEKKNEVVVEKTGSPAESYDDFAASLPENDCRYAVYDFDFVTSENCQRSKIFFIAWSPSVSRIRAKMLYATSKARFRRELEGIHYEIQATDPTEMDLEVIRDRAN